MLGTPFMSHAKYPADDAILLDTRLEERGNEHWLTGLCSFCWEPVGFRGVAEDQRTVQCKNGHTLRIVERGCAGFCGVRRRIEARAHG